MRAREAELFGPPPRALPGIDLNEEGQLALLAALARFYPEHPFPETRRPDRRFHLANPNYTSEAILLFCLLRHLRPRRIVEVGSGHSSCAILDTNQRFFDWGIDCTFVEPYPELLDSLLLPGDRDRVRVVRSPLHAVPAEIFTALEPGDLLFIDSTHVSKIGSDVNRIVFEILPQLQSGVYVHFHDVYYPFEYPREWIYQGRAWNEAYLLRAFLQYNRDFRIVLFNAFLAQFHRDALRRALPRAEEPGSSLWLQRV